MKSKYEIFFYEVIISEFTAVWVEKVGDCHCCKLQVEREILFATSPAFFDTVCISLCWNIANFYCRSLAREWRSCTIAHSFYAISSRVQETHQKHCNAMKQSQGRMLFCFLNLTRKFLVLVSLPSFKSSINRRCCRWLAVTSKAANQLRQWSYKIIKLFTL